MSFVTDTLYRSRELHVSSFISSLRAQHMHACVFVIYISHTVRAVNSITWTEQFLQLKPPYVEDILLIHFEFCWFLVNTDITFLCFFVLQSLQCVSTSSPYCHLFLLWFKPLSEWSRGLQCLVVTIVVIWQWINKLKLKSVLMTHRSLSLPQRL